MVGRCGAIDLPILHAHAFRKKTVSLGITVPWYVTSRIDVRGKASRRTVKYLRLGQFLLGDWAIHIFHYRDLPKTLFDQGGDVSAFLIIICCAHRLALAMHLPNRAGSFFLHVRTL